MSTKATDTHERYPTTGPDDGRFDRYASVTTGDELIIYDEQREDAWVQATKSVALDEWR